MLQHSFCYVLIFCKVLLLCSVLVHCHHTITLRCHVHWMSHHVCYCYWCLCLVSCMSVTVCVGMWVDWCMLWSWYVPSQAVRYLPQWCLLSQLHCNSLHSLYLCHLLSLVRFPSVKETTPAGQFTSKRKLRKVEEIHLRHLQTTGFIYHWTLHLFLYECCCWSGLMACFLYVVFSVTSDNALLTCVVVIGRSTVSSVSRLGQWVWCPRVLWRHFWTGQWWTYCALLSEKTVVTRCVPISLFGILTSYLYLH